MDIFSKEIIVEFRIIADIAKQSRDERDHLKRELELFLQNPNATDECVYMMLDNYYKGFSRLYKCANGFCNLIAKMWKDSEADIVTAAAYEVKYNLIHKHAPGLYYGGQPKLGQKHYNFYIERENWIKLIYQCSNGLKDEFASFNKQYWEYREWLKH